jgi:hypothetical protein
MHCVVNPVLALLDLDLGGTTDADHGYVAGEFGQPLLQLFATIVGGRLLNLRLDLTDLRRTAMAISAIQSLGVSAVRIRWNFSLSCDSRSWFGSRDVIR